MKILSTREKYCPQEKNIVHKRIKKASTNPTCLGVINLLTLNRHQNTFNFTSNAAVQSAAQTPFTMLFCSQTPQQRLIQ